MSLLSYLPPSIAQHLAGYPPWLVITAAAVAVLAILWILGKLVKWALSFLLIVLGVGVCAVLIWLVWQAVSGPPVPGHHP